MQSFDGRRVLVTGVDGFIASHVCEFLVAKGVKVTGLVRRNSSSTLKNLYNISKKMQIVCGDTLQNTSKVKKFHMEILLMSYNSKIQNYM